MNDVTMPSNSDQQTGDRKPTSYLLGDKVQLRALREDDINDRYLSWLNDADVNRFLESGRFPQSIRDLRQYYEAISADRRAVIFAIISNETGKHVGNIKLDQIDWLNRTGVLGLMIGDKKVWGEGYGFEAVTLVVEYGFQRLNLNRISLGVTIENQAAVKVYERAGFVEEGRLRQSFYVDGSYVDSLIMAILREDFSADGSK